MKLKIFIIAFLLMAFSYCEAQVAVIANKSVKIGAVSANTLLNIYRLDKKTWDDGSKIVLFDLKADDNTKSKFYSFIGQKAAELKKVWLKLQLTGEGKAPEGLGSEEEMLKKVSSTPGAVGFVEKSKAGDNVKILVTIP